MAHKITAWLSVVAYVAIALWLTIENRASRRLLEEIRQQVEITPIWDRATNEVIVMELEAKWTDWQGIERVVRTTKQTGETATEFEDRHHAATERQRARYPTTQPVGGPGGGQ